jgi:hypothetical protein
VVPEPPDRHVVHQDPAEMDSSAQCLAHF